MREEFPSHTFLFMKGENMREEAKVFNEILNTFENDDIKNFAIECIETIPPYFFTVPASSTGKYHPNYALGDGGLARHTVALCRILNHILNVECFGTRMYSSRERDLMRVAGIMHDSRKSGSQEDYEKNKYTKHEHPILAAEEVRLMQGFIPPEEVELVAGIIETHMGQWNTTPRSNVVLPKPEDKYQRLLHLADYLASRKDIEISFDIATTPASVPATTPEEYVFSFGKHKGAKLLDVLKTDKQYLLWARENISREPLKSLLKNMRELDNE